MELINNLKKEGFKKKKKKIYSSIFYKIFKAHDR